MKRLKNLIIVNIVVREWKLNLLARKFVVSVDIRKEMVETKEIKAVIELNELQDKYPLLKDNRKLIIKLLKKAYNQGKGEEKKKWKNRLYYHKKNKIKWEPGKQVFQRY